MFTQKLIFIAALFIIAEKYSSDGKESVCSAGDLGSISGLGRSPGEGKGNPLQSILAWRIPWTEEIGRLHSMVL